MAAASTPATDAAKVEADAQALVADAEAKAKTDAAEAEAAGKAKAETEVKAEEPVVHREFEVLKNFTAHVETQLINFVKGDILHGIIGEPLHSKGAPVKPLEPAAEK
jgi:hypothetical protein